MTAGRSTSVDEDRRAAVAQLPGRIAFIGLGLIGGSIARALREAGAASRLIAWSPDGRGPAEGERLGVIDVVAGSLAEALDPADLVVMAGPPLSILEGLDDLGAAVGGPLAPGATITDVASTKARIVAKATELRLPFVGGHPMAGRESSGVGASTADLFLDRPWVVVPAQTAEDRDVARVEALAGAVGARPIRMNANEHDRAVAAISHLPLVVAAALVEAVAGGTEWGTARSLAATGWADMTRLARGDADMGAGILTTNAAAVAERLRVLRRVLDDWIAELESLEDKPDAAGVRGRLAAARASLGPESER